MLKAGENPAERHSCARRGVGVGAVSASSSRRAACAWCPTRLRSAASVGKGIAYMGTNLSPALLGVGYIVGLNIGIVVVAGGILSWNIAIPIYSAFFLDGNPALAARLVGAGAEDAAGASSGRADSISRRRCDVDRRYLDADLAAQVTLSGKKKKKKKKKFRSGLEAARAGAAKVGRETERDLPMKAVLIGLIAFTAAAGRAVSRDRAATTRCRIPMTIIMIVAGFLFSSVSAYMAGLVGSSNNPVSGITIGTILFASLVLAALMGSNAPLGPVAAIVIGAVVCCAAAVAGDNLQDLKGGYMIGATPWRQQVMLAIGAASCALVMAPVLEPARQGVRHRRAHAEHPNPLLAPQADVDGVGGERLVWWRAAVGFDLDRRGDWRGHHHLR